MMDLSIVIPVFKCSSFIVQLEKEISEACYKLHLSYEIIFIDDCSPEYDWQVITELAEKKANVKGISLSRNFGQHSAIFAGLRFTSGDFVAIMDGDLQDVPMDLITLYNACSDVDIVRGVRSSRKDSFVKRMSSDLFYSVYNYLTGVKHDARIGNFGIYKRNVIEALLAMGDSSKFFPSMISWVGFEIKDVEVTHSLRKQGKSSYSWRKLFDLAFNNMISFSEKPLWLTVKFGFVSSILSLVVGLVYIGLYFTGRISQPGYLSIFISIWFFSGIIVFVLGVLGLYIGKIFEVVKNRPDYIVAKKVNL